MLIRKENKKIVEQGVVLGLFFVFFGTVFMYSLLEIIGLILLLLLSILFPISIIPALFVLASGSHVFNLMIGGYGNVSIYKIVGLTVIVIYFIKLFKSIVTIKFDYLSVFLIALIPVTYLFVLFSFNEDSLREWMNFSYILFLFFIVSQMRTKLFVEFIESLVFIGLISVYLFGFILIFSGAINFYDRVDIFGQVNPNRLAMFLVQISLLSFGALFMENYKSNMKYVGFIGYLFGLLLILSTGSRTALLAALLAPIVMTTILFFVGYKIYVKYLVYSLVVFGVFALIIISFQDNYMFLERFAFKEIFGYEQGSRYVVSSYLVPYVIAYAPLVGIGFGGQVIYDLSYNNYLYGSAHNMFIDIFLQMGIAGLSIFIFIYIFVFIRIVKALNLSISISVVGLLYLGAIFNGMGETVFLEPLIWVIIGILSIFLNSYRFSNNDICI